MTSGEIDISNNLHLIFLGSYTYESPFLMDGSYLFYLIAKINLLRIHI